MDRIYYHRVDEPTQDLNTYLSSLREREPEAPILSWIEPMPGPTPGSNVDNAAKVQIILRGWPSLTHPIDEARLFWGKRALQAVSNGNSGCRIFEFSEELQSGLECSEEVTISTDPFLLWTDWQRFGLTRPSPLEELQEVKVTQYFREGVLLAWRLVP